jgi:hypothetical protein
MRAAPAVAVTIRRSPRWIGWIGSLVAAAVATALAWAAVGGGARWLVAAATLAWGLAVLFAEWRRRPVGLRWDRQSWHFGRASGSFVAQEATGDLHVAVDLGDWMLLRFAPADAPTRRTWLVAQRGSAEGDWHALRCAVYSPRPPRPLEAESLAADSAVPPA